MSRYDYLSLINIYYFPNRVNYRVNTYFCVHNSNRALSLSPFPFLSVFCHWLAYCLICIIYSQLKSYSVVISCLTRLMRPSVPSTLGQSVHQLNLYSADSCSFTPHLTLSPRSTVLDISSCPTNCRLFLTALHRLLISCIVAYHFKPRSYVTLSIDFPSIFL